MHKTLTRNTLFSGAEALVVLVVAFLNMYFLTRGFGLNGYGVYGFLLIFSIWGGIKLFDFGLEGVIIHDVAKYNAENNNESIQLAIISGYITLIVFGLVGSLIVFELLSKAEFIFFKDDVVTQQRIASSLPWLVYSIPFQFMSMAGNGVIQGFRRFDISKVIGIAYSLLNLVIVIGCVYFELPFSYLFLYLFLLNIVRALATFICMKLLSTRCPSSKFGFVSTSISMIKRGSVLFVSRIVGLGFNQVDKIIISIFLSAESLGVYEILKKIVAPVGIIKTVCVSALLPEFSRNPSSEKTESLLSHLIPLILMFTVITSVAIVVNGEELLTWWTGTEFEETFVVLMLMFFGGMIVGVYPAIYSSISLAFNHVKYTVFIGGIGLILNSVMSILLIEKFELAGVVFATLLSYLIMFLLYLVLTSSKNILPIKMITSPYIKHLSFGVVAYLISTFLISSIESLAINNVIVDLGVSFAFLFMFTFIVLKNDVRKCIKYFYK